MPPNAAAAGMYLKQERRSDGESGQDRTGSGETGQDRAEQERAVQDSTRQYRIGQYVPVEFVYE
jgi:hypothetical protein